MLPLSATGGNRTEEILNRVSEESEVFRLRASSIVGRETLRQKARQKPQRFRLRTGEDAYKPPPVKFNHREIVSEYSFAPSTEAPDSLLEFREIISVDGRTVAGHHKARETLTLGISSNDDKAKKRMLRRFQRHGLKGAATDFGQLLLLFRRGNLGNYEFSINRTEHIGANAALVVTFVQKLGPESFTIFEGRNATHARLEGELWVRQKDFVPLRIVVRTSQDVDGNYTAEHIGTVDYQESPYGILLPASVRYRHTIDGELLVENKATYASYQMFTVQTEIKFSPEEGPIEEPAPAEPSK